MSELLDFNGAEQTEFKSKYLEPGNQILQVTEVSVGKSSQKQTPFLKVTVANSEGASCSDNFYLTKDAFEKIYRTSILNLISAANNIDFEAAKAKLVGVTIENIADKLAPVLVGKPFAITINGEWVYPEDTEKNPFIKAVFASFTKAVPTSRISELRFDPTKNIRGKKDESATTAPATPPVSSTASQWGK